MDLPGTTEPVHVYEYNSRGLKTQEDPGRPEEIRWTYDAAGRVKRVEYPSGTRVDSTYTGDGVSYVTTASLLENGTLQKVEVRKNLRGWVTSEAWEIDGVRYEIRYAYDDAGNRTSMTYPDGTTVSFAYNERNQLVRIPGFFEGPAAGVWTDNAGFRYDANGFLIGLRSVNGIETTFQPDERNRLAQISSPPLTLTYAYTPGGNVASITDASNGTPFTTAYGYDGVNRLVSAQVHMPTGIETVQYVYDALGNRIKEAWTDARGAIDSSYLPGNYLVQRGSTSYSWGTYGQLILKDGQPTALGGETNYDYNARRLMTQVRVNGSPVAQFFYDPYGRRVKTVEGDTTTLTLYSGNDIVYEIKTKPGQPTVTTKYLAINGKYLAKVVQEGTNPPQTYFYHTDLVGSVRAITDSQGQVVARFEYEPFGVTVQASGLQAGELHRFDGKRLDAAISLYYFNARYYDPVVGRFISMDQVREGLNWYLFCYANPLLLTDPTGLASMGDFRLWEAGLVVPYDREAAVAYAERYALHANPSSALEKGLPLLARWNDCTSFASQVLHAGGIPERDAWHWGGDTYTWDWFPLPEKDHVGHTLSWVESEAFAQWLLNDPYILTDVIRVSVPTNVKSIRDDLILAPLGLQQESRTIIYQLFLGCGWHRDSRN